MSFSFSQTYLPVWNVPKEVEIRFYTRHLEYISNYIRWLVTAKEKELPVSVQELIAELKMSPGYRLCRQNYRREYAYSRYLAMLVPVLTRMVEKENVAGICRVFTLEKYLLRIRNN